MSKIAGKVKDKLKDAKDSVVKTSRDKIKDAQDTVVGSKDKIKDAKDSVVKTSRDKIKDAQETVVGSKGDAQETGYDSTQKYKANEPMSAAKIKEHEPTAVKREMTEKITEEGKRADSNIEEAKEKARRSGMTKGTAGT